jgi:hypothetical protein
MFSKYIRNLCFRYSKCKEKRPKKVGHKIFGSSYDTPMANNDKNSSWFILIPEDETI